MHTRWSRFLKKKLNASRPPEHPLVRGGENSKRLDGIMLCSAPMRRVSGPLYGDTPSNSMDQLDKVANPVRGQLNREIFLSPFAPEKLVPRDESGSSVPRQPSHLLNQAESGAYLWDSYRFSRRRPFIYFKPSYAIGSVPSLSGHVIAYRWLLLPRVHRHKAGKPQGSSSNGCYLSRSPWTNEYAPLFPTPIIGMKWVCWKYRHFCHFDQIFQIFPNY